jgi:hypothetical protein
MTFDPDEAVAEVCRGTRHAGSSATMFSAYIGLQCTSDTEVPRKPAREPEQSIGLLADSPSYFRGWIDNPKKLCRAYAHQDHGAHFSSLEP